MRRTVFASRSLACWSFAACLLTLAECAAGFQQPVTVAATVDNQEISLGEVDRLVSEQTDAFELEGAALDAARAEALRQLVGQVIILEYLKSKDQSLSDDELKLEMERLEAKLQAVGRSLNDYAQESQLSESGLQRRIRFERAWQRHLEKMLTAENLKRHFERYRRELDGTRVHVQHLLLAATPADDTAARALRQEKASTIRLLLERGELTWEAAVSQYSQGPSAADGGDLGWIERHAPMPESFSRAAFALEAGQISPPVTTRHGVHLVRCVEVEPGPKTWPDVVEATRRHASRFLFDWIIERHREQVTVHYSGACPYWDPEGNLVKE